MEDNYQITPAIVNEAVAELVTIRDMVRWAASQFEEGNAFYGHGTDNCWDESLALVLPTLNLPIDSEEDVMAARLTKRERLEVADAVTRRVNESLPVAYITFQGYFCGLEFFVDERVLIPRSPIAELIQAEFSPMFETPPSKILDMCTGSACIAIACAMHMEDCTVDAVDISKDALEVAQVNVDAYDLNDRVTLIRSDLFKELPKKKYDLIIANPPYVPVESMETLPAEYQNEPEMALVAGEDGLDYILPILARASEYLTAKGVLIMEVGEAAPYLIEAMPKLSFTWLEFENGGEGVFAITAEQLATLNLKKTAVN